MGLSKSIITNIMAKGHPGNKIPKGTVIFYYAGPNLTEIVDLFLQLVCSLLEASQFITFVLYHIPRGFL